MGKYFVQRIGKAIIGIITYQIAKEILSGSDNNKKKQSLDTLIRYKCKDCHKVLSERDFYELDIHHTNSCPSCGSIDSIERIELSKNMYDILTRTNPRKYYNYQSG